MLHSYHHTSCWMKKLRKAAAGPLGICQSSPLTLAASTPQLSLPLLRNIFHSNKAFRMLLSGPLYRWNLLLLPRSPSSLHLLWISRPHGWSVSFLPTLPSYLIYPHLGYEIWFLCWWPHKGKFWSLSSSFGYSKANTIPLSRYVRCLKLTYLKWHWKLGIVTPACNPNSWEAETGGPQFKASLGYTARLCL